MTRITFILAVALAASPTLFAPVAAQSTASEGKSVIANVADCSAPLVDDAAAKTMTDCALSKTASEIVVQRVQSNSTDAAFGVLPSRINLQADQAGESASLSIGTSDSGIGGLFRTEYALKATFPFSKKKSRGDFITESGLPDAYSLEASISLRLLGNQSLVQYQNAAQLAAADVSRTVRSECRQRKAQSNPPKEIEDANCEGDVRALATLLGISAKVDAAFVRLEELYLSQRYLSLQLVGGIGREGLDHRDPVTLTEIDDDKTVYNAAASLVYLPRLDSSVAYIAGVEHTREFELPDAEIRCPSGQTQGPTVTCFEAAFGPPVQDENTTVFAGMRFVSDRGKLPIGLEIRFAIDPGNGEWGIEAPVYFIRDSKDQLNAGVRFAYDSEKDDAAIGLFVGQSFGGLLGD